MSNDTDTDITEADLPDGVKEMIEKFRALTPLQRNHVLNMVLQAFCEVDEGIRNPFNMMAPVVGAFLGSTAPDPEAELSEGETAGVHALLQECWSQYRKAQLAQMPAEVRAKVEKVAEAVNDGTEFNPERVAQMLRDEGVPVEGDKVSLDLGPTGFYL